MNCPKQNVVLVGSVRQEQSEDNMIDYGEFCRLFSIAEIEARGDDIDKIKEENRLLCERYPFLIPRYGWQADVSESYDYEYTYLDDIPQGWKKAFGVKMCEEIRDLLIEANFLDEYRIVQVKEKFGRLDWHSQGVPEEIYDQYHEVLNKYRELSKKTCVSCGEPGVMRNDSWICPWCDKCYDVYVLRRDKSDDQD